jgi:hypothetical protein
LSNRPTISSSTPASIATVTNIRRCIWGLYLSLTGLVM